MTDEKPIGVAIIGSGIFAKAEHLPAILASPQLSLKAVYSRSVHSAKSLSDNASREIDVYSDETADTGRGYDDLLKEPNIDAVVIALPILAQPTYIRKALKAGKHVLSEKPIANDSETARGLLELYRSIKDTTGCTWSIAENMRFFDSLVYAASKVQELGRVLGFRHHRNAMMRTDEGYYNTAWRKTPEHQGGFVLDGGIHSVAGLRMLLGRENEVARVSAFTAQLQQHLAPVDTVNATILTKTGVSGTFTFSVGTTFRGIEFAVACEAGTVIATAVSATTHRVVVVKDGKEEVKDFSAEGYGVVQEIEVWCRDIRSGGQHVNLTPEEALKDLEVLEALLRSGENAGAPFAIDL